MLCLALAVAAVVVADPAAQARPSRALWVWDSTALVQDAAARQDFLEFCRTGNIDIAWVQVARAIGGNRLLHESGWRSLLREAHLAGIKIHALDGDPEWVLRERHGLVLALVDTIIRFNRDAPVTERFDGIHLDNEPYLLPGWQLPDYRERLLADYLQLNATVQQLVRAEGGLEYGVDIPFWWNYRDEQTGGAIGDVTFAGTRKAASFHILDLVDNVGVMAYRNVAAGTDGIVAHAKDLLTYANGTNAKVLVAVETSPVERVEMPKLTFDGRSNAQMEAELAVAHEAFSGHRSYAGFAIHHYEPYRRRFVP
jgi:hypothetical protein